MLNVYELYDLHMILVAIRSYPDASINNDVVSNVVVVLSNRIESDETNQFRKALQSVKSIEKNLIFEFVFTENKYSYFPLPFLKDERIYAVLLAAFEELIVVLNERNLKKIVDLADCLHNLPIILVENNYTIPKSFWKTSAKYYRNKWNNDFLRVEQKALKKWDKTSKKAST